MKFRMVHNNLNVFDLDKSIKFDLLESSNLTSPM